MNRVKVFRLNDYEWWAGSSLEEVKKDYLETVGVDEEGAFDDTHEISEEGMKKLKFVEADGSEKTFQEKLDEMVKADELFPSFFASTEY